jgi:hypothetical protein
MLGALVLAAAAEPAAAQIAPPPVSLARIRAELARPPAIDLSVVDPSVLASAVDASLHFHVEVQGRRYYRDIAPLWETQLGPTPTLPPSSLSGGSPALVQVDLLRLGRRVGSAVSKARRATDEDAAYQEVEAAKQEFCADRACDRR